MCTHIIEHYMQLEQRVLQVTDFVLLLSEYICVCVNIYVCIYVKIMCYLLSISTFICEIS